MKLPARSASGVFSGIRTVCLLIAFSSPSRMSETNGTPALRLLRHLLDRVDDVVGAERLAVVELDAGAQLDLVDRRGLVGVPLEREPGLRERSAFTITSGSYRFWMRPSSIGVTPRNGFSVSAVPPPTNPTRSAPPRLGVAPRRRTACESSARREPDERGRRGVAQEPRASQSVGRPLVRGRLGRDAGGTPAPPSRRKGPPDELSRAASRDRI